MKKVALVFGTRPEAIKMIPLYFAFQHHGKGTYVPELWVTAQHREMLDQVLTTFEVEPHHDLNLMKAGQTIEEVTTSIITELSERFRSNRPDLLVVQGDTTTTFAAALAAFYAKIPVAHIEAGLRTFNRHLPYPEEINRQLTSRLADFHFAATEAAHENLLKENISPSHVWTTGNTVIDALDMILVKVRKNTPVFLENDVLQKINQCSQLILITGHRRENFGVGLENICDAIKELASKKPECMFVFPVHLNPNVRAAVCHRLDKISNVILLEPLEYKSFVWLMDKSYIIISDSGGIQEEAPHLGKPILVTRDSTERPEGVEAGTAKLVGTDTDRIVTEAIRLLDDSSHYETMSKAHNPYGDGKASERIAKLCCTLLSK